MLIVCFSDIHGNLPALEAAASDAKARGAERIYCAGDLTGYGPFPDEVCTFLRKNKIPSVAGNYDLKVIDNARLGKSAAVKIPPKKRKILRWTTKNLSGGSLRYLAGLKRQLVINLPGKERLMIVHGSPDSPDDTIYPSVTERGVMAKLGKGRPDVLVCGHTHIPFVKRISGVLVINCGSTGYPVDGDARPAYALISLSKGLPPRARIIRFEYDLERTLSALAGTSMPGSLRKDFALGIKRRSL